MTKILYSPDPYIIYDPDIHMFSANGVPFPLDDYLELKGKPTTSDIILKLMSSIQ